MILLPIAARSNTNGLCGKVPKRFLDLPFLILVPPLLRVFYGKIKEATRNGSWEGICVQPELVCPFSFL